MNVVHRLVEHIMVTRNERAGTDINGCNNEMHIEYMHVAEHYSGALSGSRHRNSYDNNRLHSDHSPPLKTVQRSFMAALICYKWE